MRPEKGGSLKGVDPLLNPEKGPPGKLWGPGEANRTAATLLSLVRNNELVGMLSAMRDLERTFNHKFNYPWTFFNDEPFSAEFKEKTRKETKAEVRYGEGSPQDSQFGRGRADTRGKSRGDTEGPLGGTLVDQQRTHGRIRRDAH